MADNRPDYSKIGFFVVAMISLIVGSLVWIGGLRNSGDGLIVETFFVNPVSGLDVGSAVNFRGVKVGVVRAITFVGSEYDVSSEQDNQAILVRMALDTRVVRDTDNTVNPKRFIRSLVDKGLHATVSASGVTGLSKIELNFPKTKIEDYPISWRPENICIPPAPSILDSLGDSTTRILAQLDKMDFVDGWTNVVETLKVTHSVMSRLDDLVGDQNESISETIRNLRDASSDLKTFAAEISSNPSLLLRSNDPERLPETR